MSAGPSYTYSAVVARPVDGDTLIVDVALGFWLTIRLYCRLLARTSSGWIGMNARELNAPGGREAAAFLALLAPAGTPLLVTSIQADKYAGRFDGLVTLPDGRDLGALLVDTGFAAAWDGRGTRPVPPWPIGSGNAAG
jgi:micrococcal nuclease